MRNNAQRETIYSKLR